jgi:RimJ/RimL family protein N-acetyltransferase
MIVSLLSNKYNVKMLETSDIDIVYELCRNNSLYYQYCPPFVSTQSIMEDMSALPPNKTLDDKYYVGYYEEDKLIAVMDLIMDYPEEKGAFIGFFMTDTGVQNKGIGSSIIEELCAALSQFGVSSIRLGWVKGNPQAERFWHKNGFIETGATYDTDNYTVVVAQRSL